MPVCQQCGQYYISNNLECTSCQRMRSDSINSIGPFVPPDIKTKSGTFRPVNPPPPPSILTQAGNHSFDLSQLDIQNDFIHNPSIPHKISLFRRAVCLIFNEATFDLLLQLPWVKRITGSIIEVRFFKELSQTHDIIDERPQPVIFKILLRLSLQFIPDLIESNQYDAIELYLKQCHVQDEISLKLSPAYLIIGDKPLPNSWYHFLSKSRKTKKPMHYLTRDQTLNEKHYKSFILDNAEDLFLSFVGEIMGLREINRLSIIGPKDDSPVILYDSSSSGIMTDQPASQTINLEIREEISYCMGHGGIIESKKAKCKLCFGELCEVCLKAFFICPGSLNVAKVHKFIN